MRKRGDSTVIDIEALSSVGDLTDMTRKLVGDISGQQRRIDRAIDPHHRIGDQDVDQMPLRCGVGAASAARLSSRRATISTDNSETAPAPIPSNNPARYSRRRLNTILDLS